MSGMFPETSMPQGTVAATENQSGSNEEQVAVDLNQRVEVADPSKDINIVPPPPPAGEYVIKWEVGEKGIDARASAKVGTFVNVPLVGTVVSPKEFEGRKINENLTSIYNQLKQTSALHDFLYKIGISVPPSATQGEILEITKTALANNPVGTIELEWKVSERNPADPRKNKDGYVTYFNKMTQFPKNPDGSYANTLSSKVDGQPIYAQAYVSKHLKK